ncbi:hypothetical protein Taro_037631 [Colocasia esculenta]|uniref:ABC1 atypical kinase-like domain-containing protein n=1 Tax=Colocasia esculenta TaxID=4460 RepID=A0A843WAC1_COLES|nr:hypothetical protein [Colocasia esculenta]
MLTKVKEYRKISGSRRELHAKSNELSLIRRLAGPPIIEGQVAKHGVVAAGAGAAAGTHLHQARTALLHQVGPPPQGVCGRARQAPGEGDHLTNPTRANPPTSVSSHASDTSSPVHGGEWQDRVPAFSTAKARGFIEAELGAPVGDLFKEFEDRPIAAASLGQVHRAILHNGEKVVVKVQRPGLKNLFDIDLKSGRLGESDPADPDSGRVGSVESADSNGVWPTLGRPE